MKFFLVLLYLLLLPDSPQGSTLFHKRPVRALNTTLQTNINGTYERRNPCTNAEVETSSYAASQEFRHHTKEDDWKGYTKKCSEIITSFLRAVGNLVRFNSEKGGCFNFHINTSISQKQDAACEPGNRKPCDSQPVIQIEATDSRPPAVAPVGKIDKIRCEVPVRKYPASRETVRVEESSPFTLSPRVVQKKYQTPLGGKMLSDIATTNRATELVSQTIETEEMREDSFPPTAALTVTPAGVTEPEKLSPAVLTDIGLNIETTFEPEQLSDFLKTSFEPDFQPEVGSSVTLNPDDEITISYDLRPKTAETDLAYSKKSEELSEYEKLTETPTANPTEATTLETESSVEEYPFQQQRQPFLINQQQLPIPQQQPSLGGQESDPLLIDQLQTDFFTSPEPVPATQAEEEGSKAPEYITQSEESITYPQQIPLVLEPTATPKVTVTKSEMITDEYTFEEPQPAYPTTPSRIQAVEVDTFQSQFPPDSFLGRSPTNQPEITTPSPSTTEFDQVYPLTPAGNYFSPNYNDQVLEYTMNYPVPPTQIPSVQTSTAPPPGVEQDTVETSPNVKEQSDAAAVTSVDEFSDTTSPERQVTVADYTEESITDETFDEKQPVAVVPVVPTEVVPIKNKFSYSSTTVESYDRTSPPSAVLPVLSASTVQPVQPDYLEQQPTASPLPVSTVPSDYLSPQPHPADPQTQNDVEPQEFQENQFSSTQRLPDYDYPTTPAAQFPDYFEQPSTTSPFQTIPSAAYEDETGKSDFPPSFSGQGLNEATTPIPTAFYQPTAPLLTSGKEQVSSENQNLDSLDPFDKTQNQLTLKPTEELTYTKEQPSNLQTIPPTQQQILMNDESAVGGYPAPVESQTPFYPNPDVTEAQSDMTSDYTSDASQYDDSKPTPSSFPNVNSVPDYSDDRFTTAPPTTETYTESAYTEISTDSFPPQTEEPTQIGQLQEQESGIIDEFPPENPSPRPFLPYSSELRNRQPATTLSPYSSPDAAVAFLQQSPRPDLQSESLTYIDSDSQESSPQPESYFAVTQQPQTEADNQSTTETTYSDSISREFSPQPITPRFPQVPQEQEPETDNQAESATTYSDSISREFSPQPITPRFPQVPQEQEPETDNQAESATTYSDSISREFFPQPITSKFPALPQQQQSVTDSQSTTETTYFDSTSQEFVSQPITPRFPDSTSQEIFRQPTTTRFPEITQQQPPEANIQSESVTSYSDSVSQELSSPPTTPNFNVATQEPLAFDSLISSSKLQESVETDSEQSTSTLDQFPNDRTISSTTEETFKQPTPSPLVNFPEEQQQTFSKPIFGVPEPVAFERTPPPQSTTEIYDQLTSVSEFSEQQSENFTPEPAQTANPLNDAAAIPQRESEIVERQQFEDVSKPSPITYPNDYETTISDTQSAATYQPLPAPNYESAETAFPSKPQQTFSKFEEVSTEYRTTATPMQNFNADEVFVTPSPVDQLPTDMQESSTDFSTSPPPSDGAFADSTQPQVFSQTQTSSGLLQTESRISTSDNGQPLSVEFQPSFVPESQTETTLPYSDDRKPFPASRQTPFELPSPTENRNTKIDEFRMEDSTFAPNTRPSSTISDYSRTTTSVVEEVASTSPQTILPAVENLTLQKPIQQPFDTQPLRTYDRFEQTVTTDDYPPQQSVDYFSEETKTATDNTPSPTVEYRDATPVVEEATTPVDYQNFQSPSLAPEPQPQPSPDNFAEISGDKPTSSATTQTSTTYQIIQSEPETFAPSLPNSETTFRPESQKTVAADLDVQQESSAILPTSTLNYSEFEQQSEAAVTDSPVTDYRMPEQVQTPQSSDTQPAHAPIREVSETVRETSELIDDVSPQSQSTAAPNYGETVTADSQSSPAGEPEPQTTLNYANRLSNTPPDLQHPTTVPAFAPTPSVTYNQVSQTRNDLPGLAAVTLSRPPVAPHTTKTVETFEQEIFTTESPQRLQPTVNYQTQQQPFYSNQPTVYPNSTGFTPQFAPPGNAFYDQSPPRRLPEYNNAVVNQRPQVSPGFNYPQQVSNFNERFSQPQSQQFGRSFDAREPNRPYDQSQQQNYRMINENGRDFSNQFNNYQSNGPMPNGYNRYPPIPQENYGYQGRNYDDRNIPSDSFLRNPSFEQTRTFNDARQLPSDNRPQIGGAFGQERPPYFERYSDVRGPQMFQQQNGPVVTPQFSNQPYFNDRGSPSDFHSQTQSRMFPAYPDTDRRGFSPEQQRPVMNPEFHPQAPVLTQDNRGLPSDFPPFYRPQTQPSYSDRELRSDVFQSRSFVQPPQGQPSSFNTNARQLSPNFQSQSALLTQSSSFAPYPDRREFPSDIPIASSSNFRTQLDTRELQTASTSQEQPNQSQALVLYSGKPPQHPLETKTKIVEEIITTDIPTAVTNSPAEAQLAFAEKLLKDDKATTISQTFTSTDTSPQSVKLPNQQQYFGNRGQQVDTSYERVDMPRRPEQPPQQRVAEAAGSITPTQSPTYSGIADRSRQELEFQQPAPFQTNPRQQFLPDNQPPPDTRLNIPDSYQHPNQNGVSSVPDNDRNGAPIAPQPVSHGLVSDQTAPSNTPGEDYVSCCERCKNESSPLLCPFDPILKGNMTAPSYYILVTKLPVGDDKEQLYKVEKVFLGDGTPLNCTLGETFPTRLYTPIPFRAAAAVKLPTKPNFS